jgi:hypothetical protein
VGDEGRLNERGFDQLFEDVVGNLVVLEFAIDLDIEGTGFG